MHAPNPEFNKKNDKARARTEVERARTEGVVADEANRGRASIVMYSIYKLTHGG
jgi:hypothetical protein